MTVNISKTKVAIVCDDKAVQLIRAHVKGPIHTKLCCIGNGCTVVDNIIDTYFLLLDLREEVSNG